MKRKRTYQTVAVEQVRLAECLPILIGGCIIALDVAKQKFVVALATLAGEVVKLFRFDHPAATRQFLMLVAELREHVEPGKLTVAMEPTGTYGDAIRHQLVIAGVPVRMVSPKRTHDTQELFDNVHSLHDPKCAVLIAKLCSMNLATEWKPASSLHVRLRSLIELRRHEQQRAEVCFGRLEGLCARHWPEFGYIMNVRDQRSALRLLAAFPSPQAVSASSDVVRFLHEASRGRLAPDKARDLVAASKETLGVPMLAEDERVVSSLAAQALEASEQMDELERDMQKLAAADETFKHLEKWMGTYTAAVIVTFVDPKKYLSAPQLEKACGLNLKEKSSGEHRGRLSITKRGAGIVRKVLYLFALRQIQSSKVVRAWYERRRGYADDSKQRAVIAVMRKLVRALFHVARGSEFDANKLFDVRRLRIGDEPEVAANKAAPSPPQRARSRGTKRSRDTRAVAST